MAALWAATAAAIGEAIAASGRPASDIAAIGATAHGDGIYLLDTEDRPLGPGILSLDSRAGDLVAGAQLELLDEALPDVDVVVARQVSGLGSAQEAGAAAEELEHAQ